MWNPCHIYIYLYTTLASKYILRIIYIYTIINVKCWLPEPWISNIFYLQHFEPFYKRPLAENTFPPLPSQLLQNFPRSNGCLFQNLFWNNLFPNILDNFLFHQGRLTGRKCISKCFPLNWNGFFVVVWSQPMRIKHHLPLIRFPTIRVEVIHDWLCILLKLNCCQYGTIQLKIEISFAMRNIHTNVLLVLRHEFAFNFHSLPPMLANFYLKIWWMRSQSTKQFHTNDDYTVSPDTEILYTTWHIYICMHIYIYIFIMS